MQAILNSTGYTYDVHSLIKAFFPDEDVKIVPLAEEADDPCPIFINVSSGDAKGDGVFSGKIEIRAKFCDRHIAKEEKYDNVVRAQLKSILKRTLYDVLSLATDRTLPWGTMTGIRPTKVPMKMIREGYDDEQIAEHMRSVYLCSDEKIRLATDIAHREDKLLRSLSDNGFSLYVGIPFCPTTCMYCSFTSYPIASWASRVDEYIDALGMELDFYSGYYSGRKPSSIYIGGGTPTTLTPSQFARLFERIAQGFDLSDLREFTVEAGRPDSITKEKLCELKNAGVGRISINPQTMNDRTLKIIGRRHSSSDVYKAFELARDEGFDNINMDLILGLPGEDESDVAYTFERIEELSPDSITVHSMAIKRAADMGRFLADHPDTVSNNTPEMMEMAAGCAKRLGMKPYYLYRQKNMAGNFENVGYARDEKYGVYNIAIMEETEDIAAVGAGTISKRVFAGDRIERCDNVKDVALYIDRIDDMIGKKKKLFCKGE